MLAELKPKEDNLFPEVALPFYRVQAPRGGFISLGWWVPIVKDEN